MTAFLELSDAVVDALMEAPALAGGRVTRGRAVAISTSSATAITVNMIRSAAVQLDVGGEALQWETTIGVTLYARTGAGVDAEDAIDPLLASAWTRLSAITPPAGVFGIALDPSVQWDVDEGDTTIVSAGLALRIRHITTTGLAA